VDPTFGTTIMRLTDASEEPTTKGYSYGHFQLDSTRRLSTRLASMYG